MGSFFSRIFTICNSSPEHPAIDPPPPVRQRQRTMTDEIEDIIKEFELDKPPPTLRQRTSSKPKSFHCMYCRNDFSFETEKGVTTMAGTSCGPCHLKWYD